MLARMDHPEAEIYSPDGPLWSGEPNQTLVNLIAEMGLNPGRAFDIGCGEGADLSWLRDAGWDAHGLEPSPIALSHARTLIDDTQLHPGYFPTDTPAFTKPFDLVTAFYTPIRRGEETLDTLARLVRPGGYLLVVHHDIVAGDGPQHVNFDGYLLPRELGAVLPADAWEADTHTRAHAVSGGQGHKHKRDVVLVARRRG